MNYKFLLIIFIFFLNACIETNNIKFSKKTDIIEPGVLPAAFVMILTASCSGIIFVVTPDISNYLGISNKGWFFGMYILSTIFIRLFTGSLSDKIGRRQTLIIGCSILSSGFDFFQPRKITLCLV